MINEQEMVKFKFPSGVLDFIRDNGTMINLGGDESYFHLPYWLKMAETGDTAEIHFPNTMPDGLKKDLGLDQEIAVLSDKLAKMELIYDKLANIHSKQEEKYKDALEEVEHHKEARNRTYEKYNKLKEAFEWADKRIAECEDALTWVESATSAGMRQRYGIEQELNTLNRMKRLAGLKEQ